MIEGNNISDSEHGISFGTVIIATVKGDLHTFGKDNIATALEDEGFEVINLGDGVSTESITTNVKEKKVDFVFSFASMSTTMIHQIQIEE